MIHFIVSVLLLIAGIYIALALAGALLKIIGIVLIVAGIVWLLGAFRARSGTRARV